MGLSEIDDSETEPEEPEAPEEEQKSPEKEEKMTYEEAAQILGVDEDEEDEAVLRKAFRKQSLLHHPDKNPNDPTATARFQKIGQALEMLTRRARGEVSDDDYDDEDIFGDAFFRGATQDFDDEEAFGDFVRMMRDFMKFRAARGGAFHMVRDSA